MKRILSRSIATLLSGLLFFTNVAFAHSAEINFWRERSDHFLSYPALQPKLVGTSRRFPSVSPNLLKDVVGALPPQIGSIRHIAIPPKATGQIVIHIQDIHQNLEAQSNIEVAVRELIKKRIVSLIALEGAFQRIDLTWARLHPAQQSVQAVADYLFREKRIAGPIHALLSLGFTFDMPVVIGIDDRVHYDANVAAVQQSARESSLRKRQVATELQRIAAEKLKVYNAPLWAFDRMVMDYQSGALSWSDYMLALSQQRFSTGPHVSVYVEALKAERTLDMKQVESQRRYVLELITPRLSRAESESLLCMSTAYRTGDLSSTEFYGFLRKLCATKKIDLRRFPNFDAYLRYLSLADQIDVDATLDEAQILKREIYSSRARDEQERALIDEDEAWHLANKLIDFSLTRKEWAQYEAAVARVKNPALQTSFKVFEKFYREAEARDLAMSSNLQRCMKAHHSNVAVVVAGGFHSEGLTERLQKQGITVVTFAPKVSKVDSETGSEYLSVFTQEKTPLDKLFAGERLFLSTLSEPRRSVVEPMVDLDAQLDRDHETKGDRRLPSGAVLHETKSNSSRTILFFSVSVETWVLKTVMFGLLVNAEIWMVQSAWSHSWAGVAGVMLMMPFIYGGTVLLALVLFKVPLAASMSDIRILGPPYDLNQELIYSLDLVLKNQRTHHHVINAARALELDVDQFERAIREKNHQLFRYLSLDLHPYSRIPPQAFATRYIRMAWHAGAYFALKARSKNSLPAVINGDPHSDVYTSFPIDIVSSANWARWLYEDHLASAYFQVIRTASNVMPTIVIPYSRSGVHSREYVSHEPLSYLTRYFAATSQELVLTFCADLWSLSKFSDDSDFPEHVYHFNTQAQIRKRLLSLGLLQLLSKLELKPATIIFADSPFYLSPTLNSERREKWLQRLWSTIKQECDRFFKFSDESTLERSVSHEPSVLLGAALPLLFAADVLNVPGSYTVRIVVGIAVCCILVMMMARQNRDSFNHLVHSGGEVYRDLRSAYEPYWRPALENSHRGIREAADSVSRGTVTILGPNEGMDLDLPTIRSFQTVNLLDVDSRGLQVLQKRLEEQPHHQINLFIQDATAFGSEGLMVMVNDCLEKLKRLAQSHPDEPEMAAQMLVNSLRFYRSDDVIVPEGLKADLVISSNMSSQLVYMVHEVLSESFEKLYHRDLMQMPGMIPALTELLRAVLRQHARVLAALSKDANSRIYYADTTFNMPTKANMSAQDWKAFKSLLGVTTNNWPWEEILSGTDILGDSLTIPQFVDMLRRGVSTSDYFFSKLPFLFRGPLVPDQIGVPFTYQWIKALDHLVGLLPTTLVPIDDWLTHEGLEIVAGTNWPWVLSPEALLQLEGNGGFVVEARILKRANKVPLLSQVSAPSVSQMTPNSAERLERFHVYSQQVLQRLLRSLNRLSSGDAEVDDFSDEQKLALYRVAVLSGLDAEEARHKFQVENLLLMPDRRVSRSEDINTLLSNGYEVSTNLMWSILSASHFQQIFQYLRFRTPLDRKNVLDLCAGHGAGIEILHTLFTNSKLVMIDANPVNVRQALGRLQKYNDSNTYEAKLADARPGFDGIDYPNEYFDVITMTGDSEFGMSRHDLTSLLTEVLRVLKPNSGRLIIESQHLDRFYQVLREFHSNVTMTSRQLNNSVAVVGVQQGFHTEPMFEMASLLAVISLLGLPLNAMTQTLLVVGIGLMIMQLWPQQYRAFKQSAANAYSKLKASVRHVGFRLFARQRSAAHGQPQRLSEEQRAAIDRQVQVVRILETKLEELRELMVWYGLPGNDEARLIALKLQAIFNEELIAERDHLKKLKVSGQNERQVLGVGALLLGAVKGSSLSVTPLVVFVGVFVSLVITAVVAVKIYRVFTQWRTPLREVAQILKFEQRLREASSSSQENTLTTEILAELQAREGSGVRVSELLHASKSQPHKRFGLLVTLALLFKAHQPQEAIIAPEKLKVVKITVVQSAKDVETLRNKLDRLKRLPATGLIDHPEVWSLSTSLPDDLKSTAETLLQKAMRSLPIAYVIENEYGFTQNADGTYDVRTLLRVANQNRSSEGRGSIPLLWALSIPGKSAAWHIEIQIVCSAAVPYIADDSLAGSVWFVTFNAMERWIKVPMSKVLEVARIAAEMA